ncbi:MAG: bifunctional D-glycero-beta-D-manno-heptose-7-phosphate kinase/D-glycero-beta-D-manno-heptose 1-phosphate adenylyltransferase HldE [Gammaproteobacteria bacterium]
MNLKLLSKSNILVFGDVMLDRYVSGSVDRVSPEAPVPVLKPIKEEIRLGGAANVALNLSSLGSKVSLIGISGKDSSSAQISNLLKENKIKNEIVKSNLPTITKLRLLSSKQQLLRVDNEEEFTKEDWNSAKKRFDKSIALNSNNLLIISDYGKGTLQDIPGLIKKAKKSKKIVLVDPKGNNFSKYKGADVITPNFSEFIGEVGAVKSEREITAKAKSLIKSLKLGALLVTRGPEGMTLFNKEKGKVVRSDFPTQAQEVFDVSGAGDTVIASVAAALSTGLDMTSAVKLANVAAGIVVGKSGTATASISEIEPHFTGEDLVFSLKEAKKHSVMLRKNGKKVVFTNGCFDILHAGHVHYLEQAKELGDELVVGLNSDSSVKTLKGPSRPINNLEQRAKVLSSLKCVDRIVSFADETPIKLIKEIKPDVLVKGGDYKVKDVVGHKEIKSWGGEVKIIPLVPGLSTTNIIKQLK